MGRTCVIYTCGAQARVRVRNARVLLRSWGATYHRFGVAGDPCARTLCVLNTQCIVLARLDVQIELVTPRDSPPHAVPRSSGKAEVGAHEQLLESWGEAATQRHLEVCTPLVADRAVLCHSGTAVGDALWCEYDTHVCEYDTHMCPHATCIQRCVSCKGGDAVLSHTAIDAHAEEADRSLRSSTFTEERTLAT